MTENESAPQTASPRNITVVDAVCCVYFCGAGKSALLIKILIGLDMEILIPAEVEREVLGKSQGQTKEHWSKMRASSHIQILDELTPTDIRASVVATVARVRGLAAQLALSTRRDLGEAVVIGHARDLVDAGHEVYVVIDDQGGQTLASNEGLTILTVEDLLLAAAQLGILAAADLRKTYEALVPYGSGLPSWNASTLKQKHAAWKASQKQLDQAPSTEAQA